MAVVEFPADVRFRRSDGFTIEFSDEDAPPNAVAFAVSKGSAARHPLGVDDLALLEAFRTARTIPSSLGRKMADLTDLLARLILEGVVEVIEPSGRASSGAAALAAFRGRSAAPAADDVSTLGLLYALALRHLPKEQIGARLYSFNSLPALDDGASGDDPEHAFSRATGIDVARPSPKIAGRRWSMELRPGWLFFRRGASRVTRPFKIYLSPRPDHVAAALPHFAGAIGDDDGAVFKIAYPVESLVRPDKIVAYLPTFEALERCLTKLVRTVPDLAAQPVPFSAPIGASRLLSWGVDPMHVVSERVPSWRAWITRQIAECVAATSASERASMGELVARLALRGIDPSTWLPRQELLANTWRMAL